MEKVNKDLTIKNNNEIISKNIDNNKKDINEDKNKISSNNGKNSVNDKNNNENPQEKQVIIIEENNKSQLSYDEVLKN